MTQRQLAGLLGVSEQQVQRWEENDYHGVGYERLDEIARALTVKVHQMVALA
jgi:transcriptional regulator with XRE-family HTH domain